MNLLRTKQLTFLFTFRRELGLLVKRDTIPISSTEEYVDIG